MELVVIRGLPGTGKSLVADELAKRMEGTEAIHVDNFKQEAMGWLKDKHDGVKESRIYAYNKAIERLKELYSLGKNGIVEELVCDAGFFIDLMNFSKREKVRPYWFRIERPLEELLEVEKGRKRKVKNSYLDFEMLRSEIDKLKADGEVYLVNSKDVSIDRTVSKILKAIEDKNGDARI